MIRRPPRSTLFPYTTLFRSRAAGAAHLTVTFTPHLLPLDQGELVSCYVTLATPLGRDVRDVLDRKSTRLNSSHANISYAVFCLKKKNHKYLAPKSMN